MNFKIGKPTDPFIITQGFGVNGGYYQANGIDIKGHNGLDLRAKHGQPVYATHDGMALYQVDANQGHGVIVITNEKFDYEGKQIYFKSIYWHLCDPIKEPKLASPLANKGALPVKRGDIIGYADNTGFSNSDHLHFGIKPVALVGESLFTSGPLLPDNGYKGAIDPMPFLEDPSYTEDIEVKKFLMRQIISLFQQILNILLRRK